MLQLDHEDAHGQYEVNFAYDEALAEARGMVFSVMPKPFANQPGSGLHFHVSLWNGEGDAARCVFQPDTGAGDPPGANLSALGRHFIAVVCGALGPVLTGEFLRLKRDEALAYARHVSA